MSAAVRRVLDVPLAVHAAMLAVVLVALLPIIGTTGQFSADEGAAIAQARQLARGDGWTVPDSFPQADPDGSAFPFELSNRGGNEYAPFAKHPVYPALLAPAERVLGNAGMLLLSIAGTVAAAVVAALLARRLDPKLAVLALWVTGVASPLFFDSYTVVAHSIGAALAGLAVLCAQRATGRRAGVWSAIVAGVIAMGTMMRTEMLFFAIGLSIALVVLNSRSRDAVVAVCRSCCRCRDRLRTRSCAAQGRRTRTASHHRVVGAALGRLDRRSVLRVEDHVAASRLRRRPAQQRVARGNRGGRDRTVDDESSAVRTRWDTRVRVRGRRSRVRVAVRRRGPGARPVAGVADRGVRVGRVGSASVARGEPPSGAHVRSVLARSIGHAVRVGRVGGVGRSGTLPSASHAHTGGARAGGTHCARSTATATLAAASFVVLSLALTVTAVDTLRTYHDDVDSLVAGIDTATREPRGRRRPAGGVDDEWSHRSICVHGRRACVG